MLGTTRTKRPPAPPPAERARSIAARTSTAASLVGTGAAPATPLAHHVGADGTAALLFADSEPVLDLLHDGELAAMLELTDKAPVDLREPVRGLLWITGRARLVGPDVARRIALHMADAHPDPELLRLGHGATLVRLEPGSAVLSDAEGSAALRPVDLAAARPDPFCQMEQRWLAHLEHAHGDVFVALARHLPVALRDPRQLRIRPLGVDRCGLRLRVESRARDHDVRLAWDKDVTSVEELRTQLTLLVGCPFTRAAS